MNWALTIWHGVRAFLMVLAGTVLAAILKVLAEALTYTQGYQPEGILAQTIWIYIVVPLVVGLIALINNWRKHKNDKSTG